MSTPFASLDLSAASAFWRDFDLEMRQDVLLKTADVVAENDRRSLQHRKALATSTKAFRAKPAPEQLAALGPFVKGWQREVDDLTARAQFAEKHLLELARDLSGAPASTAAICSAAEADLPAAANLRAENARLQDEIKELEKEFEGLSNQDITIRKLEARIATLEGEQEDKVEQVADARIEELESEFDEKSKALEDERASLKRQVAAARELEVQAQTRADVAESRLFAERSRAEEAVATLQGDLDELSEARRAAVARAESAELRLAAVRSGDNTKTKGIAGNVERRSPSVDGNDNREDDDDKEEENSDMEMQRKLLQQLQDELMVKSAKLLRASAELEKVRAQTSTNSSTLAASNGVETNGLEGNEGAPSLPRQNDADLRRALEDKSSQVNDLVSRMETVQEAVMAVARRVLTANTRERLPSKTVAATTVHDVEQILSDIAREYESNIISMRVSLEKKTEQLQRVSASEDKLQSTTIEQRRLIETLEEHLSRLQAASATTPSVRETDVESSSAMAPTTPGGNSGGQPVSSSTGAVLLESVLQQSAQSALPLSSVSTSPLSGTGGGESMLKIVQAQRDRYRQRVQDLEKAKAANAGNRRSHVLEIEQLKQDNLRLYERVRFLQSSSSSSLSFSSSSSSTSVPRKLHHKRDLEAGIDRRYAMMYEKKVNPFSAFHAEEKARRHRNLNPLDRGLLLAARAIMLNRFTRAGLFLYLGLLHCILFGVLHSWSHTHHMMHAHHAATPFKVNRAKGGAIVLSK